MVTEQPTIWNLYQELHRRQRHALKNKNIDHSFTLVDYRAHRYFWHPAHSFEDSAYYYCHGGYSAYQPDKNQELNNI